MKFQDLIKEQVENEAAEFSKKLEEVVTKHFPDSYVKFKFVNNLGPVIQGRFTLFKEYTNKIVQNDPAFYNFFIYGVDKEGKIAGNLELDGSAGSFSVKSKNPMFAYERVKTGFRKKKGTPDAIIKHVDNFFGGLKQLVDEHWEEIPKPHNY